MWLGLSIASALFFAVEFLFQKKLSAARSTYSVGWIVTGLGIPFLALAVFLYGHYFNLASLPWQFWWPLLIIWFVLYPVQTYFYVRSLREGEFSLVIPLMSMLPVFNIFISWAVLHQIPSVLGFLGIALICVSVFILLKPKDTSMFRLAQYSKAGFFMILFCVCVAFGSTFDKVSSQVSEPLFYVLINSIGGAIVMGGLSYANGKAHDDFSYLRKNLGFAFLIGLVQAACFAFYILALRGGLVSYVLAIRSSSFIIAAFLGFILYKEKITKQKILSFGLIVLGLVCLAFA